MKIKDIISCPCCNCNKLMYQFPLLLCLKCRAMMVENNCGDLHSLRFRFDDYHIEINLCDNKTYFNGKKIFDKSLPIDISKECLTKYIKLVVFS